MLASEFRAHINERIAHHAYLCELAGHEPKDTDLVMTLYGQSMKGIGVRPVILGSQFNRETGEPEKIYGFSLKQCKKLLKKLDEAGVQDSR
jgi:hypothetical protein